MQTALMALLICTAVVFVVLRMIYEPVEGDESLEEEMEPFQVVITPEELACEHPLRKREAVPWSEIREIVLITTSDGPFIPDQWLIFVGNGTGCSIPTEAGGFDALWQEITDRFPGFDVSAVLDANPGNTKKTVWRRTEVPHP